MLTRTAWCHGPVLRIEIIDPILKCLIILKCDVYILFRFAAQFGSNNIVQKGEKCSFCYSLLFFKAIQCTAFHIIIVAWFIVLFRALIISLYNFHSVLLS